MNIKLQICLILGIIFFGYMIVRLLVQKRLHLKYSLLWIQTVLCMLIVAIFPQTIANISAILGFITPSNFVFLLFGLFAMMIMLSLTAIVSHINERIFKLVQTQALLELRIRILEKQLHEKESQEAEG